jgi:hypothetical protein
MKKNYKQRNWLFKLKTAFTFGFALLTCSAIAQLNGTYTINSATATGGTNYQSFTDFATDINANGVSGPVVIDVVANSGPYNEWVQFNDISGSSSTNTITLNGNSNTVSYSGTSTRSPVITFSSTDHFILDNLVIENKGNSYGRCVQIRSVSTYVTISNCQLNMPNLTSTTAENTYLLIGNTSSNSSVSSFSNAGEVVVKVGDILDVNVTDNLNGTYSVDLSVVADGVYFVQVKNGDYFATKRITVSK